MKKSVAVGFEPDRIKVMKIRWRYFILLPFHEAPLVPGASCGVYHTGLVEAENSADAADEVGELVANMRRQGASIVEWWVVLQ